MEEPVATGQVALYVALFDGLSATYDQSGVPFFGAIARGLVERLDPHPGERALDIGAGRGAATFPLAAAVGTAGRVDGIDLAPGMVRHLSDDAAGLSQVRVALGDARDPRPPRPPYDLIASSLVLFFLPDPVAGLTRWRRLLRPGGRVGVTTFQPWRGAWKSLIDLYVEYTEDDFTPDDVRFASEAGVESLLTAAGFSDVRSDLASYLVPFDDVDEWRRWSWATPMGGIWRRTPERSHPEILRRATEILEANRDWDGRIAIEVGVRYTFGVSLG